MNVKNAGRTNQQPILSNGILIKDRYCVKKFLGSGGFGAVYEVEDVTRNKRYALKIEKNAKNIQHEQDVLKRLHKKYPQAQVPHQHGIVRMDGYHGLLLDLEGPNLKEVLKMSSKLHFAMDYISYIASQVLATLKMIHDIGFVHRDLKPLNLMLDCQCKNIMLVDFGLATPFRLSSGQHVPFSQMMSRAGTLTFLSIYAHQRFQPSRRDDIESLAYVLVYLAKGRLPWQNIKALDAQQSYGHVFGLKMQLTAKELCQDLPKVFTQFVSYAQKLRFTERPNYEEWIYKFKLESGEYSFRDNRGCLQNNIVDNDQVLNNTQVTQTLFQQFSKLFRGGKKSLLVQFLDAAKRQKQAIKYNENK